MILLAGLFIAATPARLALVIGNNESLDQDVGALHFADDDAARFFELFAALGYDAHLLAVLDPDTAEQHPDAAAVARPPSTSVLTRTVGELASAIAAVHQAGGEAEVIVTFSGHGAVGSSGEPYVSLLDERLFRGDFFRDVVAALRADFAHVIVDACRGRDFVDARGASDDVDRAVSLFLESERRQSYPQLGVIVAESADGETHEWSRTRSGIFAHEVVSGLAGGADVNDDGLIEYSELHAFVAAANNSIKDPRARLRVVADAPVQNRRRPVLSLREAQAVERIRTPAAGGRFTIEDAHGVRWADVNQAAGAQVTLHLPRRARFFVIDVEHAQEAMIESRGDGALVVLSELAFADDEGPAQRGSIAQAMRSDLFRTRFGPLFYEGFVVATGYPSVLTGVVAGPFVPPPARSIRHAVRLSSLALAGASAAGGLTFALIANTHMQQARAWGDAPTPSADTYRRELALARKNALRADALFGLALAAGVVFGATWIFE